MKKILASEIETIIKSKMEPAEPAQTVLRVFQENAGKRFDKRIVDKLKVALKEYFGHDNFQCYQSPGNFYETIVIRNDGKEWRFYVCENANKKVDPEYLTNQNVCYYEAREERNAKREMLLKDTEYLQSIADKANAWREAVTALVEVFTEKDEHTVSGRMPDAHAIEELIGFDSLKGKIQGLTKTT